MGKVGKVVVVLLLGLDLQVPGRTLEDLQSVGDGTWSLSLPGPALAILIYGLVTGIALFRVLNELPGVFALRRSLGRVRCGLEYLWLPVIVATFMGFQYTGRIPGRANPETAYWTAHYGSAGEFAVVLGAFGTFVIMMWSLKLHAAMVAANRQLGDEPPPEAIPSV